MKINEFHNKVIEEIVNQNSSILYDLFYNFIIYTPLLIFFSYIYSIQLFTWNVMIKETIICFAISTITIYFVRKNWQIISNISPKYNNQKDSRIGVAFQLFFYCYSSILMIISFPSFMIIILDLIMPIYYCFLLFSITKAQNQNQNNKFIL